MEYVPRSGRPAPDRSPEPGPASTSRAPVEGPDGGGRPLEPDVRGFMERRFGQDFSQVRVHADGSAAAPAAALAAKAYTVGDHLVFRPGEYAPRTQDGRRSLAHELAHVVQQRRGGGPAPGFDAGHSLESSAEAAARTVTGGGAGPVAVAGASRPGLARQAAPDAERARREEPAEAAEHEQAPEPGLGITLTAADEKQFTEKPQPVQFYVKYSELALADQAATGVPALVTLAQMALESGWAMGKNANFFGIKADPNGPPGSMDWLWTTEPVTDREKVRAEHRQSKDFQEREPKEGETTYQVRLPFRHYSGPAEAIAGHSRVLLGRPYSQAWKKTAAPVEFAKAVAAAGYAAGNAKARAKYSTDLVTIVQSLDKAAAYARQHHLLDPVRQMTDLLKASSSSQGVEQARALIPQAIPGYFALSPEAQLAELGKLRDRLVSTGQPTEVADDIARP
ncbi:MAG TPA: DUF4157 domain-containing protein [Amycolatopsis sp.]